MYKRFSKSRIGRRQPVVKEFVKYVSSDPASARVAVYRVVLVCIVCLTVLGIVALRHQVSENKAQIDTVATEVAK